MDTKLMNCHRCSHTVSKDMRACSYCGEIILAGKQTRPTDDKIPRELALSSDMELDHLLLPDLESETLPAAKKLQPSGEDILESASAMLDTIPLERTATALETVTDKHAETAADVILLDAAAEIHSPASNSPHTVEATLKLDSTGVIAETTAVLNEQDMEIGVSAAVDMVKADEGTIQKQAQTQTSEEIRQIENANLSRVQAQKEKKGVSIKAKLLKPQKEAEARTEALRKQKAAQVGVLKKHEPLSAKAGAAKRSNPDGTRVQALQKQKEAQAAIETSKKKDVAAPSHLSKDNQSMVLRGLAANSKMLGLLKKYEGQAIGINYDNSAEIKEAQLIEANDEFFSVFVGNKKLHYNFPLKTILTVIEGQDGVDTDNSEQKGKFNVIIRVYPLVNF